MAQKTIPELSETTSIDENAIFPVDSGVQTFKITAPNAAKSLKTFLYPNAVQTKSADYTMLATDKLVRASGAHIITLPDGADCIVGDEFTIKKTDSGTTTTIAFQSAQSADGQTSLTLTEQFGFYRFAWNGTNFDLVGWG